MRVSGRVSGLAVLRWSGSVDEGNVLLEVEWIDWDTEAASRELAHEV